MSFTELQPTLDLLDMATLDRWLRSTATKNRLIAAEDLTGPNPTPQRRLAALVASTGLSGLREAVAVASEGISRADLTPVTTFLASTALDVVFHGSLNAGGAPAMTAAAQESAPGELRIGDPRLADLGLIPLATDMARSRPGGLVLTGGDLHGPLGVCGPEDGTDVIVIDIDAADAKGWDLTRVLGHEAGHLLDPHLHRRGSKDRDEAFALTLGPLLVAELPATEAEAAPLVARAVAMTGGSPTDVTSTADARLEHMRALMWWYSLNLDALDDVPAAV